MAACSNGIEYSREAWLCVNRRNRLVRTETAKDGECGLEDKKTAWSLNQIMSRCEVCLDAGNWERSLEKDQPPRFRIHLKKIATCGPPMKGIGKGKVKTGLLCSRFTAFESREGTSAAKKRGGKKSEGESRV